MTSKSKEQLRVRSIWTFQYQNHPKGSKSLNNLKYFYKATVFR